MSDKATGPFESNSNGHAPGSIAPPPTVDSATPQYGGQALIEGVMIRGARHVCIACRRPELGEDGTPVTGPNGELFVDAEPIATAASRLAKRYKVARAPFIRGTLVLLESMELGTKGLRLSAAIALGAPSGGKPEDSPTWQSQNQEPGESPGENPTPAPTEPSSDPGIPAEPVPGGGKSESAADGLTRASDAPLVGETPTAGETPVFSAGSGAPVPKAALVSGTVFLSVLFLGAMLHWLGIWKQPHAILAVAVVGAVAAAVSFLVAQAKREEASSPDPHSLNEVAVGATMALGLALGIGIFFFLPSLIAGLFHRFVSLPWALNLVEGGVRVGLFFGYLALISRMPNIHRLFQYHGAEHQVIHVHENGLDLTPENAARFPTVHPRCGTAFLAIVLVISVVVFTFSGWQAWWIRLLLRLIFLPVIAGISYELLKWNSRHPNVVLKALMAPGLWFQRITTQPPSRDQVEVAIAAMHGVLAAERGPTN